MATAVLSSRQPGLPVEIRGATNAVLAHSIYAREWSKPDPLAKFPGKLNSDLCWDSDNFGTTGPPCYVVHLTAGDVRSVADAVEFFKSLNLRDVAMASPETFPLPYALAEKLRGVSDTVHNGRGFAVLRGLAVDGSDEDSVIAHVGIGSYIGRDRCTNSNGMAMDHLRDAVRDAKPFHREGLELHPSKMMAPLKFHADRRFADILALFVRSKAASGGRQYLASSWTVYNKMLQSHPDELRVLVQDFPWPGMKDGQPHTSYSPVFFHKSGRILCQLVYRIFEGTNLLTPAQWHALGVLEECANESAIELDVQPGDIQLVNNLGVLHARRGWVDLPGRQERHYYRLGLRDPENAWDRPDGYGDVFDARFGVMPEEQMIPVSDFDPYGLTSLADMSHG